MRQPMVAGNWKMNGSREFSKELVNAIVEGAGSLAGTVELVVCPPSLYIGHVGPMLGDQSRVVLGAQNLDFHDSGAYTGEISATMLTDVGCGYVIVGHSERRALYGETNNIVARKVAAALEQGLPPILCVGETLEQRESSETEDVIGAQLDAVVSLVGIQAFSNIVVAYEPVWAIGTGKTATPEQAQDVHAFVRRRLADLDQEVANGVRILYGGSVKPDNAADLFANVDIDGGLIGGASLKAEDFLGICRATG